MEHLCYNVANMIQSSYDLSMTLQYLVKDSFQALIITDHRHMTLVLFLGLSFCGISERGKNIVDAFIVLLRVAFKSVDYIDDARFIPAKDFLHTFQDSLPCIDVYIFASLLCSFLRIIEIKFGPKKIPDQLCSFSSPVYLSRLSLRKCRQLFEFVLFTMIPGFYLYTYFHGDDLSVISKELSGHCSQLSEVFGKLEPDRVWVFLLGYVGAIVICGLFQRVFGSNPSYKESIYDQYGDILQLKSNEVDNSLKLSDNGSSEDDVERNEVETSEIISKPAFEKKKTPSSRRRSIARSPTEIYSVMGSVPTKYRQTRSQTKATQRLSQSDNKS
jgi:hypothetical protein